jgi:hypothetical protein
MGGRRFVSAAIVGFAGVLALAPAARASFHEISIREVYPGPVAQPDSGYVELQMYAGGQQLVGGHSLTTYGAAGAVTGTFTFPSNLSNGANQQTILIGDSGVQSAFGVTPDLTSASFAIGAGGAACWAGSFDCVAWGAFSGSTPSASGSPADPLGIPDGMALRRTIEPGCATLLQPGDDSNVSAGDFFDATPQPRNNASAIVEQPCTGPAATIDTKPANPTNATAASFTYHSTPVGASFECKLDAAPFAGCAAAGVEYAGPLGQDFHTFQVRAKSEAGTLGNPVSYSWRVDTTAPTTIIDSHPADPSADASASFAFHASEAGSSFQCSLAQALAADAFSACSSGKTYTNLADGEYTFKALARDPAGNEGLPASFDWAVDRATASTFHLVMLREVYPGSSASPGAEYVELQMYASGQELVQGHKIDFLGPTGAALGTVTFDSDVPRGANQSTILAATAAAEEQFGIVADKGIPGVLLDPSGGAVCWEALDCVSWGSFSGSLPSPAGSPATSLGIPDGMALRRTIAPGCPTLLEAADDRNDSASDFAAALPSPRPNSVAPGEQACAPQGPSGAGKGPGAGGGAGGRPQTRLGRRPARIARDRTPTFGFSSDRPGSSFLCKLDGRRFRRCRSPFTTPRLTPGAHVFRVKARAPGGANDRSPAIWRFTVTGER